MDDRGAISSGGLDGKAMFFGSTTAETISSFANPTGNWEEGQAFSVNYTHPWFLRGGQTSVGAIPNIFAALDRFGSFEYGEIGHVYSHRTILSGY